jgi:hypothetical protein
LQRYATSMNEGRKTCCGEHCQQRHKTGRYLRKQGTTDQDDLFLCFTCWSKEHVRLNPRTCSECNKTHAGGCWYKSKTTSGADLCTRCYEKERRTRLQENGAMKCTVCAATESSSKWRTSKDKSKGKMSLCNRCYLRECRATKDKKKCCICTGVVTTAWHKHAVGANTDLDICNACYVNLP